MPKLIIFDLDGTLTPSKSSLEPDMATILCALLSLKKVLVIGGGSLDQFLNQFLKKLNCSDEALNNLYLMPTSGAMFYKRSGNNWEKVYEHKLTEEEKHKILSAFEKTFKDLNYIPPKVTYGDPIEDRGTQISFSALGQKAPLEIKSAWDPDHKKRLPIEERLKFYLPEFDVKIAATTTIDITKKGINKAYGVREMVKFLNLQISDAVYIGDALYENGNDAIVKETGIETIQVAGPEETAKVIQKIINNQEA